MKKILVILMTTIISLYVPKAVWAQDENTDNSGGESNSTPKTVAPLFGIAGNWHRGFVLEGGISLFHDSTTSNMPPMTILLSWGYGSYPSFGLGWMIAPIKKARFLRFGIDAEYDYTSNIDVYSELFRGGLGTNTIKGKAGTWNTTMFAISPAIEISIKMGKWSLSSKANLVYGYWNYNGHAWGHWRRYYEWQWLKLSKRFGK